MFLILFAITCSALGVKINWRVFGSEADHSWEKVSPGGREPFTTVVSWLMSDWGTCRLATLVGSDSAAGFRPGIFLAMA